MCDSVAQLISLTSDSHNALDERHFVDEIINVRFRDTKA